MMVESAQKKYVLFLAAYLFLAIVGAVFACHDAAWVVCLARGSLSGAVSQANFVPQADMSAVRLDMVEETALLRSAISTFCSLYRGPPFLEPSAPVHLQ